MNNESKFKPGDTVYLASGGPTLTVVDVGMHTGIVLCQWMDEAGLLQQACFAASLLAANYDHRAKKGRES